MSEEKKESRPPAPDKDKITLLQESSPKPPSPKDGLRFSTEKPKGKPAKKESSDK
ncbi:hypothetical protein [Persephonella sp.]